MFDLLIIFQVNNSYEMSWLQDFNHFDHYFKLNYWNHCDTVFRHSLSLYGRAKALWALLLILTLSYASFLQNLLCNKSQSQFRCFVAKYNILCILPHGCCSVKL